MKKEGLLLQKFLNANNSETELIKVDIRELVPNEKNFYGMRDIDELADMIEASRLIEPLSAYRNDEGKLVITSGHRRRAALIKLIEERGSDISPLVNVVVHKINAETDGEAEYRLTSDELEKMYIIFQNSHRKLKPSEIAEEMKQIQPILKKKYEMNKEINGRTGLRFRTFCSDFWKISETALSRFESFLCLPKKIQNKVDEGIIPLRSVDILSKLDQDEIIRVVDEMERDGIKLYETNIRKFLEKDKNEDEKRVPAGHVSGEKTGIEESENRENIAGEEREKEKVILSRQEGKEKTGTEDTGKDDEVDEDVLTKTEETEVEENEDIEVQDEVEDLKEAVEGVATEEKTDNREEGKADKKDAEIEKTENSQITEKTENLKTDDIVQAVSDYMTEIAEYHSFLEDAALENNKKEISKIVILIKGSIKLLEKRLDLKGEQL